MGDPRSPEAIGAVLQLRLGALVAELHVRDGEIRDGVDDGLHQARVTCRRLRAALVTLRQVLVPDITEPIRDDLQWLAVGLGDARDAEVMRARLERLVLELVDSEQRDATSSRIDRRLARLDQAARQRVAATLASERYPALLAALDRLVAHPPWTANASRGAAKVLRRQMEKERRRVDRMVERAVELTASDPAYDAAVHDVRKAVKRLRYGWELAEPVLGEEATHPLRAARSLTRQLGERQDIMLTRMFLSTMAADAAEQEQEAELWERLRRAEIDRSDHIASETLDMLKSGILSAGVAVREK